MGILNVNSFPPGSSRAFIDTVLAQEKQVKDTSDKTDQTAKTLTEVQAAVNLLQAAVQAAQTTANNAQSTATSAQSTANTALANAATAQTTANTALSAANSANAGVSGLNTNAVRKNVTSNQIMVGPLESTQFRVDGVKVVGERVTGWSASTGTSSTAGIDGSASYAVGAAYTQAEIQAIADGLVAVRQLAAALQSALTSHGLIGA